MGKPVKPCSTQRDLAVSIAKIHAANLRHRDVRFVDQKQVIVGKIAEKSIRGRTGRTAAQWLAIVLNAGAIADFLHHLQVESRAGVEAMGFDQFAGQAKLFETHLQFFFDSPYGAEEALFRQHEMLAGINIKRLFALDHFAGSRIDRGKLLDLVAPEFDAQGKFFVAGPNLNTIAADAKLASC